MKASVLDIFKILLDLFVYQPIKSTLSLNLVLTANLFPVSFLYCSQVPLTAWEYPNELEGLLYGIILKIPNNDAFKQYVAYHEGWGNYKHYKKNKKIINLAKRVEKQSDVYKNQLKECKNSLSTNKYIIF